jgi:hypothetical protein
MDRLDLHEEAFVAEEDSIRVVADEADSILAGEGGASIEAGKFVA